MNQRSVSCRGSWRFSAFASARRSRRPAGRVPPNPSVERRPKTVGRLLVAAGILMFGAGVLWCVKTAMFASHASKAQGTIIGNERSKTYGRGEAYYPIYAFVDDAGITHNAKTPYASSTFAFKHGDHVTVLYEHEDPTLSTIDSFKTLWLGPVLVMGFGLLFGGFALIMLSIVGRNIDRAEDAQLT